MKDEGGKGVRDLRARTKDFALRAIRVYQALPRANGVAQVLGKQALRSATSVAAHYREAHRAKSNPDFINKIEGALQELDEMIFGWNCFANEGPSKHHALIICEAK